MLSEHVYGCLCFDCTFDESDHPKACDDCSENYAESGRSEDLCSEGQRLLVLLIDERGCDREREVGHRG